MVFIVCCDIWKFRGMKYWIDVSVNPCNTLDICLGENIYFFKNLIRGLIYLGPICHTTKLLCWNLLFLQNNCHIPIEEPEIVVSLLHEDISLLYCSPTKKKIKVYLLKTSQPVCVSVCVLA